MRRAGLALLLAVAACASGASRSDAGTDGGPAQACSQREAPVSSPHAPHRIATPQPLPLPPGRSFGSSPVAARGGGATVALFPVDNGVAAVAGSSPSGAFVVADRADTPALAALGSRFFAGYRAGGQLSVGLAEGAQGLVQLGAGRGRTLPIPLPQGATDPRQLVLAASPGGEVVAAFTATMAGQRAQVFAARLRDAGCAACTLAFDAPAAVSTGLAGEELPQIAAGPRGAVAVSFLRPGAGSSSSSTAAAQVWVAQATLGASALAFSSLQVFEGAPVEPAPLAYFSDGSLALVHGRLTAPTQADGGVVAQPEVGDLVARHLTAGSLSAPVRVATGVQPDGTTQWLPGAAVDAYDRLWVAWYDTRFGTPGDAAWGPGPAEPARSGSCTAVVMLARSDDKATSFLPDGLVTPDGQTIPFDPVPQSLRRERAPLGPVTVTASDTELLVGYSDGQTGRGALFEGLLP